MGVLNGEAVVMESFFNEVSLEGGSPDHIKTVHDIIEVHKALKKHSISRCRTDSLSYSALLKMFSHCGRTERNMFYAAFCQPFDKGDEEIDREYLRHEWKVEGKSCQGLAYAFLNDSVAISLSQSPWSRFFVNIMKDSEGVMVRNVFSSDITPHLEWLESSSALELITTDLCPSDKVIALRDDHGQDMLRRFAKRLCNSQYVVRVINSMPFNSHLDRFIRRTYPDGRIEMVLNWTDLGIGLVVQSTGRNQRETDAIAEILKAEFSK